jgi:hypothetical protein
MVERNDRALGTHQIVPLMFRGVKRKKWFKRERAIAGHMSAFDPRTDRDVSVSVLAVGFEFKPTSETRAIGSIVFRRWRGPTDRLGQTHPGTPCSPAEPP